MTCVMLGGSRHITRLADEVVVRLSRIVAQGFRVVVGDANGADKAFQSQLAKVRYGNVEVFCAGTSPRNNVGRWACRQVEAKARMGTFEFYAAKDQAMAKEADVGLMLWDGVSVGTMLNVWRLQRSQKPSVVFHQPARAFHEVRSSADWDKLLALATADARADIAARVRAEARTPPQKQLGFDQPDLHALGLG